MKKASAPRPSSRRDIARLEDIPNVGPAVAADLRRLGITAPDQLSERDPYALYDDLCRITGQRHDPCLLDTFIAAVRYMEGGPKKPWWKFTAELRSLDQKVQILAIIQVDSSRDRSSRGAYGNL